MPTASSIAYASPVTKTSSSNRDTTLNIRASRSDVDIIDRAATIVGKNRTNFMVETARREAECVLLDRRLFLVDEETHLRFLERLDAPPQDNPNLRRLMQTKASWER